MKQNKWFYDEMPIALESGDSAKKMCSDLCDTCRVCVRAVAELTPSSSLVEYATLHCKGTVPAYGLMKPGLAWQSLEYQVCAGSGCERHDSGNLRFPFFVCCSLMKTVEFTTVSL